MRLLNVEVCSRGQVFVPRYDVFAREGCEIYHLTCGGRVPDWPFAGLKLCDDRRLWEIVEQARLWHLDTQFDAVITTDEASVICAAAIAERLGLPGLDLEAGRASRNKLLMRQAHAAGGAPHPAFRFCTSTAEALRAAADIGYPVVIKPTLGGDAEHVYRVDDAGELATRFPAAWAGNLHHSHRDLEAQGAEMGPDGLLVEAFLEGPEHCVEAWVLDGTVVLGSIADRISVELETFDNDLYKTPTSLAPEQVEAVRQAVQAGASAQGVRHGVLHAELRFHRGKPVIVEIAARPGGGSLFRMARISYRYCPIISAIAVACNRRPPFPPGLTPTGRIALGLTMLCDGGRLVDLHVPESVRRHPSVFNLAILPEIGSIIRRPPYGADIFGFLGTEGETLDEAKEIAAELFSQIRIELEAVDFAVEEETGEDVAAPSAPTAAPSA